MLIVCNGAQKGGSTWIYNLAQLIRPRHKRIPDSYQQQGYRSSSISRDRITSFVAEVDYLNYDYICKQHWYNRASVRKLANDGNSRFIDIIRDIRDVSVSRYYHDIRLENVAPSIPFRDYLFDRGFAMIDHYLSYQFYWHRVHAFDDVEPLLISYEGLKIDFSTSFLLIAEYLETNVSQDEITCAHYLTDISSLGGLSHYRKGIVGDWLNHYSPELASALEAHIRTQGYFEFLSMIKDQGVFVADDLINGNWAQLCSYRN